MGALWKVRDNLNTTLGDASGDLAADLLFSAWMNAYDQTTIDSVIEIQWLTPFGFDNTYVLMVNRDLADSLGWTAGRIGGRDGSTPSTRLSSRI